MLHNDVGTSFGNTSYKDDDMCDAHDDNFEDYGDFDEEPNAKAKEFYKIKNRHNCSNNGFDELLHLIGLVFDDHKFPEKYYIVQKMIRGLNMEYEKIDACEKEHSEKTKLRLSTDGFDPFRDAHAKEYTVWPVVAILWTISDFAALAMLSGWSNKGSLAKTMCEQIQFPPLGKSTKRKSRDYGVTPNWTYISPFFELPYWETLSLRHNIDIMHNEKNFVDNIFYTILDDGKNSKENTKARNDYKELHVHRELWIQDDGTEPHAPYVLSKEQIHKLFKWIEELKLPCNNPKNFGLFVTLMNSDFADIAE
ncbi:hypothetical protein AgCh_016132 [Apium graveolens]